MAPTYGPPLPPFFNVTRQRRSRRRAILGYVLARFLLYLIVMEERNEDSYVRGLIRSYFRGYYMDRQSAFLDCEFRIIYRMSRRSLEQLRHDLYPYLRPRLTDAQIEGRARSNRRPLSVDEKIGIGLMTAGGCTLGGILQGLSVGRACAIYTIERFFDAVLLSQIGEIHLPQTLYELQAAADAYYARRPFHSLYYGCIGALDGLAVRIPMPELSETEYPLSFFTRKGFCAVNVQAISDAHDKCISLSVKTAGSTHDSTAWAVSDDHDKWKRHVIVDPRTHRVFWLSTDAAYKATENQVPPWPGTGLISRAPYKDAFNYFLSSGSRNGIERLFGQIYQRWGILWRPIFFPLHRVPIIVTALFQLHNYLKDLNDTNLPAIGTGLGARQAGELRRAVNVVNGYDEAYHRSDECSTEEARLPRVRRGQCPIREEITEALEQRMEVRPPTNMNALASGVQL